MTHNTRDWEERFEARFIPNDGDIPTYIENGNDLKDFIHQELQKEREETIRDMERKMMGWSGTATAMLKDYRKIIYRDQSELDQAPEQLPKAPESELDQPNK